MFFCLFLLHWVFNAVLWLSLVAASRGCSPGAALRLLTAEASLAGEHGPEGAQAH